MLHPNVEDEKETFLSNPNAEEKEETFLCNTMSEDKEESFLYYSNVSSEDRGEFVPFSSSDWRVVCPQEFFAGVDHREFLVCAGHFLFVASLSLSVVDCVVEAGTTELLPSGLSEDCMMETDTAESLSSGPFVDSPDVKSQMAIHIENGVSVRAAYKAMRKRVRIEARRQRELEEGRPPEVLLESFLELLKHKLRRPPRLPKHVLTSAAQAAKDRRGKDKRRRETPCWWIANGKDCFKRDRCAFKHLVPQVKGQTTSKTGVSPPGLATDRHGHWTKVPLLRLVAKSVPCPSVTPEFQRSAARSIPHLSATPEFQGSAASVLCSSEEQKLKEDPARDHWIE